MIGLVLAACNLPLLARAWSFESAIAFYAVQAAMIALVITPSLAYMAEATTAAGVGSFGASLTASTTSRGGPACCSVRPRAAACTSTWGLRG